MSALFWVSFGALWLIVAVQGFAFLEVLRQVGEMRRQLGSRQGVMIVPDAVKTGAPLPELSGQAASDLCPAKWDEYLGPGLNLLVLLTAHCITCRHVAEELKGLAADVKGETTLMVILDTRDGQLDEAQTFIRETGLDPRMVVIDEGGRTAKQLGVGWNPAVVTVHRRELGEAAIINDATQLHALIHGKELAHAMAR